MKHGACYVYAWLLGADPLDSLSKPFAPPTATLKELHSAVPKDLLRKRPLLAAAYIVRDVALSITFFALATRAHAIAGHCAVWTGLNWTSAVAKMVLWMAYWWFQGLLWAGIFCLGVYHGYVVDSWS